MATAARLVAAEVSVPGLRWPLIASIRAISSVDTPPSHRAHRAPSASYDGLASVARPRGDSSSRVPASRARPPARISIGHANAAIGSPFS
jgi:hypothetical protein